jgi:hypothetical protein
LLKNFKKKNTKMFHTTIQHNTLTPGCKFASYIDVILPVDFSEYFNCKYDKEIQSTHLRASQKQVSIHTNV